MPRVEAAAEEGKNDGLAIEPDGVRMGLMAYDLSQKPDPEDPKG